MQPNIEINYLAVAACVVSNVIIGFLWYGPLFGKAWARYVGIDLDDKPPTPVFVKAMLLMIVGAFFMAYVLAHSVAVWRPSVWGIVGKDSPAHVYGFFAAMFTWIGYIVPVTWAAQGWEKKPWGLFLIQAGYYLVALMVMGMILAHWR